MDLFMMFVTVCIKVQYASLDDMILGCCLKRYQFIVYSLGTRGCGYTCRCTHSSASSGSLRT